MLLTALAPKIGYEPAAAIAKAAQLMGRRCAKRRYGSASIGGGIRPPRSTGEDVRPRQSVC
jgi:hypothetical protein